MDELDQVRRVLQGFDEKLKHMSVLQAEIATSLVPTKTSGTFQNVADLNNSIKNREKLLDHAKIFCKWMYRKPLQRAVNLKEKEGKVNRVKDSWRKSDEPALTKDSIEYLSNAS